MIQLIIMSRKEKIRSEALEFNIKKFLECTKEIKNFNELNRAWAWYDCQNAFNNNHKLTPTEIDYRAEELFIYLANWGMVARGSFIMKHTWRILKEVVTEISKKKYYDLRKITISETEKDSHINTINSLYEEIAQILYKYHEDYKPDDSVQEKKDKSVLKVSSALITKILLANDGKELPKELKVKIMRIRMSYNKIKKQFDEDTQEFSKQIVSDELRDLANKTDRTPEEEARFNELNTKANSEYQEYLIQKGTEDIKDAPEDTFTEDEYGDILDVNSDGEYEINSQKVKAADLMEAFYELFVK